MADELAEPEVPPVVLTPGGGIEGVVDTDPGPPDWVPDLPVTG
jgi:hypothetical protein